MDNLIQKLDGIWQIAIDPNNRGKESYFKSGIPLDKKDICVPAAIQEAYPYYDGVAWYFLTFDCALNGAAGARYLLKFGAVDYLCEVWLNENYIGCHEDGEEPFSFDVTDALEQRENTLAVRVLSPYEQAIGGIVLDEIPHRNKTNKAFKPGEMQNNGGIMQTMELLCTAPVRIEDAYIKADPGTGRVDCEITFQNHFPRAVEANLTVQIFEHNTGLMKTRFSKSVALASGSSVHMLTGKICDPVWWSTENPFLYDCAISLKTVEGESEWSDSRSVRIGFRDFRVVNGYFHLNGKRVFLKCAHTGNHMPVGFVTSRDPEMIRKDLLYAKACGFNAIRFIAGMALPEQLDFCDEIGLMVYEECNAAWKLPDSPYMAERFDRATSAMIRRDRDHPSVTIWGLLNETEDGPVFDHAAGFLAKLRALDDTRLVLLASGRFDCRIGIGSLCNPGSGRWEYEWGAERDGSDITTKVLWNTPLAPYAEGMGDIHIYPTLPQTQEVSCFIRTVGKDSKPIFVSEYGHGSQNNVIQEYLKFAEHGCPLDGEDVSYYRQMADRFLSKWKELGFDGVYSFPEDFFTDSMRVHCDLRRINLDVIRANPKICGYNLTGLLDHAMTGEGLWTFWRTFKPGIVDTVTEGWAPLKWCLFADHTHWYAGRPLHIEAVLANEDVLKPGSYPACFRIRGEKGIVWEKEAGIRLPEDGPGGMPPLAVPVLDEWVTIDEPDEYEFAVSLQSGGAPAGGRRTFRISDTGSLKRQVNTVTVLGLDNKVKDWLTSAGAALTDYHETGGNGSRLILAGCSVDKSDITGLFKKAEEGYNVVFLSASGLAETVLSEKEKSMDLLPFEPRGKYTRHTNFLYHFDVVTKRHAVFEGLDAGGIMTIGHYGSLFPEHLLTDIKPPDNTLCAAFGVGQQLPGGTIAGVVMGEYRIGKGKVVLNTLNILENMFRNPVAERVLFNIVKHYA